MGPYKIIAGMTATRNHPSLGTASVVRNDVPLLANPSKSVASPETKLNISSTKVSVMS